MPDDLDPALLARVGALTARERDCLRLIVENRTSKEVGRMLGISHTSVDTHVRRARAKLGLRDRYAAARLVSQWETEQADAPVERAAPAAADPTPALAAAGPAWWPRLPPMETLGPWQRLGLVLVCAFFIAVLFGVGLTALMAL